MERNFVYLNQGGGKFQGGLLLGAALNDEGQAVSSMGCDVRDYDNDGWPDIFYNDLAGQTFGLFHNEAGQGFRYVSQQTGVERISRRFSGWGAAFADFDNDGWKDIYSANGHVDDVGMNTAQRDTIFRNTGGRTFVDVSLAMGKDFIRTGYQRGAAVGDLNNDGFPDLVVSSLGQRPRILINSGVPGNHWITIALTGVHSNRDAIGATVKVTTRSGRA
ncbi:MAG: VCBS repeat-containing protein, partial [Bryobacteraceae bacterium]